MKVSGARVVITGAASGLGRRMAMICARRGAEVVAWDLNREGLDRLVADVRASTGREAHGFVVDVTCRETVYATAKTVTETLGPVDIVINNAGVVSGSALMDIPDEMIEKTFQVNTLALYWVTKAFLGGMMERERGHVVTIASASGLIGLSRMTDYAASKHAAMGFDESLRVELAETAPGIRTTVVCPYFIDTGMFDGVTSRFPRLLPILKEPEVAEAVIDGIERNKTRVMLPPLVALIPIGRVLPTRVFDAVAGFFGINKSMDHFRGRGETGSKSK